MPHLAVNRPRLLDLMNGHPELGRHFLWEGINALVYAVGGVVFIAGSVFFFPGLAAYQDVGAWTFVAGSLLYLVVNLHDAAEIARQWRSNGGHDPLEVTAAGVYLAGTLLFVVGSALFLSAIDRVAAGAWCFVTGSLLFLAGACVNVLRIFRQRSRVTLQLMNLTAISFIAGSLLFAVASVPYLWRVDDPGTRALLFGYLAWQFVIGSALFLLGGAFNYWRAWLVMREEASATPPPA